MWHIGSHICHIDAPYVFVSGMFIYVGYIVRYRIYSQYMCFMMTSYGHIWGHIWNLYFIHHITYMSTYMKHVWHILTYMFPNMSLICVVYVCSYGHTREIVVTSSRSRDQRDRVSRSLRCTHDGPYLYVKQWSGCYGLNHDGWIEDVPHVCDMCVAYMFDI